MKKVTNSISKYLNKTYEFWPMWLFYGPFIFQWIYYMIRMRSITYFTLANPSMRNGGFTFYSKSAILQRLPQEYYPKTEIINDSAKPNLNFPFIAKPDKGERGKKVSLIHNENEWNQYYNNAGKDIQVQEYVDWPLEFGVFYYRYPNSKKGKILGITGKSFLKVKGDGKSNLESLIKQNKRVRQNLPYLLRKFKSRLSDILLQDEELILEEIGNHNRGTYFYDASTLITNDLIKTLDEILIPILGFYFGRIDLKTKGNEPFQKGQFVILEINGINSEATHIFDERYVLQDAYRIVRKKFRIQYEIAKMNKKAGHKPASTIQFISDIYQHLCFLKSYKTN